MYDTPGTAIDVALLDMAGTTVDEHGVVESSFRAAFEVIDAPLPPDFTHRFTAVRGGAKLDMFRALLDGDHALAVRANDAFAELLAEAVRGGVVTPLPGAAEAVEAMKRAGVKVALITGFDGATRDLLIDSLGWSGLADLVLSASDVPRGRPAPDLIFAAALRLSADSARSVAVVGDTVNDLLAGSRAGAGIVAGVLTGAHGVEKLGAAPHTHILPSVAEFATVVAGVRS